MVCGTIARILDLPCPSFYLACARQEDFPKAPVLAAQGEVCVVFASEDKGMPSFEALLRENKESEICSEAREALWTWAALPNVLAFDEFIANADRHEGNVLFDESHQSFHLIDHSHAFDYIDVGDLFLHLVADRSYGQQLIRVLRQYEPPVGHQYSCLKDDDLKRNAEHACATLRAKVQTELFLPQNRDCLGFVAHLKEGVRQEEKEALLSFLGLRPPFLVSLMQQNFHTGTPKGGITS